MNHLFSSHLKPSVWKVSLCPEEEPVFLVQCSDVDGVLLSPLALNVMAETAGEINLGPVVDITADAKLAFLKNDKFWQAIRLWKKFDLGLFFDE